MPCNVGPTLSYYERLFQCHLTVPAGEELDTTFAQLLLDIRRQQRAHYAKCSICEAA